MLFWDFWDFYVSFVSCRKKNKKIKKIREGGVLRGRVAANRKIPYLSQIRDVQASSYLIHFILLHFVRKLSSPSSFSLNILHLLSNIWASKSKFLPINLGYIIEGDYSYSTNLFLLHLVEETRRYGGVFFFPKLFPCFLVRYWLWLLLMVSRYLGCCKNFWKPEMS